MTCQQPLAAYKFVIYLHMMIRKSWVLQTLFTLNPYRKHWAKEQSLEHYVCCPYVCLFNLLQKRTQIDKNRHYWSLILKKLRQKHWANLNKILSHNWNVHKQPTAKTRDKWGGSLESSKGQWRDWLSVGWRIIDFLSSASHWRIGLVLSWLDYEVKSDCIM